MARAGGPPTLYDRPQDLSQDDDFLAHVLLDCLALPGRTRLGVHYASETATVPDYEQQQVLDIVTEYVCRRSCAPKALIHLLETPPFKRYVASLPHTDQRTRAFNSHALYYLNLYLPRAPIDIGPTPRYTRITHKDELAVFATAAIPRWTVLRDFVAGNTAPLGREEEERMTGADSELLHLQLQQQQAALGGAQVPAGAVQAGERARARVEGRARRDFSMVFNKHRKMHDLFLGPARFVNHDCDPNCELESRGKGPKACITLKTKREIRPGEELTTFYAKDYFGPGNTECLCATCERKQRGFFARALASPPPASPPPLAPPPVAAHRRGERAGSRSSTPEAVRSEEGEGDEEVSLLLGGDEGEDRESGGLPDGASSSTVGGKQQEPQGARTVAPLPRRSTTAVAAAAATGKTPSPPLALSTSASPGPLPSRPLPTPSAAHPAPLGRCSRCTGTLALTARINGHVVPECPRCWRHRKLHGLLWPAKAQTGRAAVRLGPGPLTDTENGVFYGPAWANEDGESTENDEGDEGEAGGGAGSRVESADELELAIRRKRKGREWDGDAFELCEKADFKFGLTFCYTHVRGVTLSRTLDDNNLPIVNLTSLLKLAGIEDGPELRGRLFVDPPDTAAPMIRNRWLFKGVWVQREYAVQIARELKLSVLLERFLEHEPRLGWPAGYTTASQRAALALGPSVARRLGPTSSAASSVRAPSSAPGDDDDDEVDPCLGRPAGLDESSLPLLPKSEFPAKAKVALPAAQPAVAGKPASAILTVNFPIHRVFYQCEPVRLDGTPVVVQRDEKSHWLNLTAILTLAGLDRARCSRVYAALKPTREKWLYGALDGKATWEGVWTPLAKGRELARRYGVDHLLHPTFLDDKREFLAALGEDAAQPILVDMLGVPLADQSAPDEDEDDDDDGAMEADDESDRSDAGGSSAVNGLAGAAEYDSDDERPLAQVLSLSAHSSFATAAGASSPAPRASTSARRPPVVPVVVGRSPTTKLKQPKQEPSQPAASTPIAVKRIKLTIKAEPPSSNVIPSGSGRLTPAERNKPIPYAQPAADLNARRPPPAPYRPSGRSVPKFRRVKTEQASPAKAPAPPVVAPQPVMNFRKIQRPPGVEPGPSRSLGSLTSLGSIAGAAAVPVKLEGSSSNSVQFLSHGRRGSLDTTPIDLCDSSDDGAPAPPPPPRPSPTKVRGVPGAPTLSATDKGKGRATSSSNHISQSFSATRATDDAAADAAAAAAAANDAALRQLGLATAADAEDGSGSGAESDDDVVVQMSRIVPIVISDDDSDDPVCVDHVRPPPRSFIPTLTGGDKADEPIELDLDSD